MIVGRITAKSQTTVPRAVRLALGLGPGDEVAWAIDGDRVTMTRVSASPDPFLADFSAFTEWSTPEDCDAFHDL